MKRSHSLRIATLTSSLVLALAACSGGGPQGATSAAGPGGKAAKGGTVRVLTNVAFSHLDPVRGLDGGVNNFYRLIYRGLTTFGAGPGAEGTKVVPDLATTTGTPSDDNKTWTFTLKEGHLLRGRHADHQRGREVRRLTRLGSRGRHRLAVRQAAHRRAEGLQGPVRLRRPRTIETPDAKTIVFHLKKSYADFASASSSPRSSPSRRARGRPGRSTAAHRLGPYQVASYKRGASLKLDRNEHWKPGTDTVRKALPDHFAWTFGLDGATIDERMIADQGDDANAIAGGSGIQAATVARIQTPQCEARTLSGSPAAPPTWA